MIIVESGILFILSTILFDILHVFLHKWKNSRFAILRLFSEWHDTHHKFLNTSLTIDKEWGHKNMIWHIMPEYLTSMIVTAFGFLFFSYISVLIVLGIHSVLFFIRLIGSGEDVNHFTTKRVSANHGTLFVKPSYHLLHHVYPTRFYGSFFTLVDLILGTANQIDNRVFLITGASGAFGSALKTYLEDRGATVLTAKFQKDYNYDDYSQLDPLLKKADVLVLAHGAKYEDAEKANFDSFTDISNRFIELTKERLVPPEIWGLGSEIEIHGSFGLNFLKPYSSSKKKFSKVAKKHYLSDQVIYRHIVPSAFTSPMGKGLMSGKFAVKYAMFFIMRGFFYIPVTYTGLAYINYFRFRMLKP